MISDSVRDANLAWWGKDADPRRVIGYHQGQEKHVGATLAYNTITQYSS